ncbi:MAG: cytochrome c-type biogenesis protein CcmH [Solirubrobacteraceae bacterium]
MRRALLALAALLALGAAPAAHAAPADFNEVEAALMCDTCNVPLNIAESTRADQERRQIRRLIAQGKSKQEILDIFVAEYGSTVLADPSKAGGTPAVWLIPLGILLAALAGVAFILPRWRRNRRAQADAPRPAPAALSPEDEDRLARDLALYER